MSLEPRKVIAAGPCQWLAHHPYDNVCTLPVGERIGRREPLPLRRRADDDVDRLAETVREGMLQPRLNFRHLLLVRLEKQITRRHQRPAVPVSQLFGHVPQVCHQQSPTGPQNNAVQQSDVDHVRYPLRSGTPLPLRSANPMRGKARSRPASHSCRRSVTSPVTPGRPPMLVFVHLLRHRIEARCSARSAAPDAKERHPAARPQAVTGNRLVAVLGTCRDMPAGISDEAGQGQLIETDKSHPEEPAGRPAVWSLPVA